MKWRKDNPEAAKANDIRYDHTERRLEKRRERSRIAVASGWSKSWQRNNKDKLLEYKMNRGNKFHKISTKEWSYCKEYFNYECAYCGMHESVHKQAYKQQLHKEHVIHDGRNDIKNCIPSCRVCNSSKHTSTLSEWYNINNPNYTRERYLKIYEWLRYDCKNIA